MLQNSRALGNQAQDSKAHDSKAQRARVQDSRRQRLILQRRQNCWVGPRRLRPLQDSMMQHLLVQVSKAQRKQQLRVHDSRICPQSKRLAQLQSSRAQGLQALQGLRMQHSRQYVVQRTCW
jgi:hypothetical protein